MDTLLIGGRAETGAGDPIDIVDPTTGDVAVSVSSASAGQVDAAIAAAAGAWPAWRDATQEQRSASLHEIAADLDAEREDIAKTLTLDTGRPFARNLLYVDFAATVFRQYAELARIDNGRSIPGNDPGSLAFVLRVPYGVVGCLVPWNYPLDLLAFKVAPALATGNTVVVKGASETTLSTLRMGPIFARHTPPGVVNLVAGGRAVGEQIIDDDRVDMIAFTGSTSVGRAIGARCADLTKPVHLELGGKDPAIVFADVAPEVAARGAVWAAMLNAGQVCTSTERVYVHRSVHDRFVDAAADIASSLRVGDPMDPDTQIGPMRNEAGRRKALTHVDDAVAAGATLHVGGRIVDRPGFYFEPTVLSGVEHSMAVMREETFGPVLPVMAFDDDDEAFALAADTPYGLGASIYTTSPARVERAIRELRVGGLWVNDAVVDNRAGPLAGARASGNGRELGIEGLHAFTQVRHVQWTMELSRKPWWY